MVGRSAKGPIEWIGSGRWRDRPFGRCRPVQERDDPLRDPGRQRPLLLLGLL